MRPTSTSFVVAAALAGRVQAAVVEHWWNITWTDANPDGVSYPPISRETLSDNTATRQKGHWC